MDSKINLAVAESLGWTKPEGWGSAWPSRIDFRFTNNRCATFGVPPGKTYEQYNYGPITDNLRPVPNYTGSLDACVEFEEKLDAAQYQRYLNEYCFTHNASATALYRCEAYLRVIGKWTEVANKS